MHEWNYTWLGQSVSGWGGFILGGFGLMEYIHLETCNKNPTIKYTLISQRFIFPGSFHLPVSGQQEEIAPTPPLPVSGLQQEIAPPTPPPRQQKSWRKKEAEKRKGKGEVGKDLFHKFNLFSWCFWGSDWILWELYGEFLFLFFCKRSSVKMKIMMKS